MTYHFVGFYYCHYDGTEKEDEDNSASVYLFVHDEKHLAVESLVSVLAVQYQTAVIPCRPTAKDVEVTLHDEYGNDVPVNTLRKRRVYQFDPHIGFTTNDTARPSDIRNLHATFKRNNRSEACLGVLTVE
ncbi:unnamed protein product, partial [Callosobruchus maculatus]